MSKQVCKLISYFLTYTLKQQNVLISHKFYYEKHYVLTAFINWSSFDPLNPQFVQDFTRQKSDNLSVSAV